MKKQTFTLLCLLPVLFMAACDPVEPYAPDDGEKKPVISGDWKYITLYFSDTITPSGTAVNPAFDVLRAQMAMTPDTARTAFDFFEVVFYHSSPPVVSRTSWEIGGSASIGGVYRTSGGIDYSLANTAPAKSAILFAGRKTDKTLLAAGKLVSVDGVPGTVVTTESSFVTFELSALTASVNHNPSISSFTTAAGDPSFADAAAVNTQIINALIGGRSFPLYKLPAGKSAIAALYSFALDGAEWDDFSFGIICLEAGEAIKREARYPAGTGRYWYPDYPIDVTTGITMENNQAAGGAVQNPVIFSIDTAKTNNPVDTENGIFSLTFEIPVYALTDSLDTAENEAVIWHIRPAYQSYLYNIDNGKDSTGGAVLMSVGIDGVTEFEAAASRR